MQNALLVSVLALCLPSCTQNRSSQHLPKLLKTFFPSLSHAGKERSFSKIRPDYKCNPDLEQKRPINRQQTYCPNGAKAFAVERKQMTVRLDWLWTKWLWNSSGCGYDRCVPQVIVECRFGISAANGVESTKTKSGEMQTVYPW